jgi:hypothetical protein
MGEDRIKSLLGANGFAPGFTPFPNEFLDLILPFLAHAEARIAFYVGRRTFGFGKGHDGIGLGQICNGVRGRSGRQLDFGAGISRPAAIQAIRSLAQKGLLQAWSANRKGRGAVNVYALVMTERAKEWLHEEMRLRQEKVRPVYPSRQCQIGQVGSSGSGNSANPSVQRRVSPVNTQEKGNSAKKDYSRDEAGTHSDPNQNPNHQKPPGRWLDYDGGPEFDQREATWWNPGSW